MHGFVIGEVLANDRTFRLQPYRLGLIVDIEITRPWHPFGSGRDHVSDWVGLIYKEVFSVRGDEIDGDGGGRYIEVWEALMSGSESGPGRTILSRWTVHACRIYSRLRGNLQLLWRASSLRAE